MYSLVHLVIWYFIWVLWHFSRECVLHILCWCVLCFRYDTAFTYIMITLAWPIMEDIESIDLRLGDRLREFETVTHFTFRSEQYHIHIHIHTLTLWTWWPTHFELDMTPPLGTVIWPLPFLFAFVYYSTIAYPSHSFPWFDQVESEMVWLGVSSTRWYMDHDERVVWLLDDVVEVEEMSWSIRIWVITHDFGCFGLIRDGDFYETMVSGLWW